MKTVFVYVIIVLFGLIFGSASALRMAGLLGGGSLSRFATVNVNDWTSDPSIGAASANAYTRARIARHGLLALSKEEAIYFGRNSDDAGDPLVEDCTYELSGGPQDAFWWSITLYDADSRLPMNEDEHLSLDATTVGNTSEWTATISPERPDQGYWLSSRSAGQFDLTLRLYRPAADVIEDPENRLFAPRIRKVSCEGST
ncbi:MAG: DUF1214 domain-containing protein [Pseudomonadota bacterium]